MTSAPPPIVRMTQSLTRGLPVPPLRRHRVARASTGPCPRSSARWAAATTVIRHSVGRQQHAGPPPLRLRPGPHGGVPSHLRRHRTRRSGPAPEQAARALRDRRHRRRRADRDTTCGRHRFRDLSPWAAGARRARIRPRDVRRAALSRPRVARVAGRRRAGRRDRSRRWRRSDPRPARRTGGQSRCATPQRRGAERPGRDRGRPDPPGP
jgi:hypothetical protein